MSPIRVPLAHLGFLCLMGGCARPRVGVVGELYVAGGGLAAGYLGRPIGVRPGLWVSVRGARARMYRTGDLVR